MIEPLTATGLGLAVLGSGDLLNRLLGPTADYVGGELKNVVERCNINLDNVFRIAVRKLGSRIENPGGVSPRVLKHVFDEALFCEDEMVAEYLGGVLASSRATGGRDDRGVCFLNDVKSLSTYQLRTHFLVYSAITRAGCPKRCNPSHWYGDNDDTVTLMFSDDSYETAMEYRNSEKHGAMGKHSFLGLQTRRLSTGGVNAYEADESDSRSPRKPWRYVWLTQYGHELYAWGLGLGDVPLESYFDLKPDVVPCVLPHLEVLQVEFGRVSIMGTLRKL